MTRADRKWRLIGFASVAVGQTAAWAFGGRAFEQAQAGVERVHYNPAVFALSMIPIIIGWFLVIMGEKFGSTIDTWVIGGGQATGRQKALVLVVLTFALVMSVGSYFFLDSEMTRLGYGGGGSG